MQQSTLWQVFKTLSKKEVRELHKFVRSPFFNHRSDVISLYDYLAEAYKNADKPLGKEAVFLHVFPDSKQYDDSQIRYAMSFLLDQIRQYLAYKDFQSEPGNEQMHLVRALRKRALDSLFEKEWSDSLQAQTKQPFRNISYHYQQYQLHLEHYEFLSLQKRSGDMHLQELSDHLSVFYLAELLRHGCIMLTHQHMTQQKYDRKALEKAIELLDEGLFMEHPAIAIYYHVYHAMLQPEEDVYFNRLKTLIENHWQEFPEGEIRDVYILAINYCIKRLNSGKSHYMREAFDLYRSGLEKKALLENGILSRFTYNNAVVSGLFLHEFDWVRQFLEEYKEYLSPKERENTYRYNLAIYYFRKPDYDQAMQLLQQVEFRDVLYNLDSRRMLMRIYYELGEYDALSSLLDSFSTYIRRRREVGYHRDNYLNLIRFVKKMLNSNLRDEKVRESLRLEIDKTQSVAEKNWLLEQLK